MRQIIKHLAQRDASPYSPYELTVYSCQFDDGSYIQNPDIVYALGNGTVLLFPCRSCQAEISSQTIEPILIQAASTSLGKININYEKRVDKETRKRIAGELNRAFHNEKP